MKASISRKVFLSINFVFLAALSLTCLLPFINLLALSFSSSAAASSGKVTFFPVDFTLASYEYVFARGEFLPALWVTVKRVVLGVLLNMALMVITAYPLSKTKEKVAGRGIYMAFFVVTMLIGGGIIPNYLLIVKLGLLDNIFALILPTALPVYNMVILMNFMRSLPGELEEAAMIDGAGIFTTLIKIIVPLLKPALATVGLFCIVSHWNDWFSGMIYMQKPKNYPLQTYLQSLIRSMEAMLRSSQKDYVQLVGLMNARTGRAAQLFLGALPVMLVYPFLQKYFTKGMILGSVKG